MTAIYLLQRTEYHTDMDNYSISDEHIDEDFGYYETLVGAQQERDRLNESVVAAYSMYVEHTQKRNARIKGEFATYQKQNKTLKANGLPGLPWRPTPEELHLIDLDRWVVQEDLTWWDVVEVLPAAVDVG